MSDDSPAAVTAASVSIRVRVVDKMSRVLREMALHPSMRTPRPSPERTARIEAALADAPPIKVKRRLP